MYGETLDFQCQQMQWLNERFLMANFLQKEKEKEKQNKKHFMLPLLTLTLEVKHVKSLSIHFR